MSSAAASHRRVLVVGAGIGGLATVIALRQAGIEAELFEAAPDLRAIQVGYGIHLWPNALRVLRGLGVADKVQARSEQFERMHFETSNGRTLFDFALQEAEAVVGEPVVGILRSELHAVLVEAVGEDAIRFGTALESYEEDGQGVTARFADGSEARGDVLIGADGVRSSARQQLFDDGPPRYLMAERHATISLPDGAVPARTFHEYWRGRERFGFYPIKGGTCWYLLGPDRQGAEDPGGHKATVLRKLEVWPDAARRIVEATPPEAIVRLEIYVRDKTKHWVAGRVGLLGDAAHAMEPSGGQGSAQAIEDAAVLARCLRTDADPAAALRSYEQVRVPRVRTMRRASEATGRIGRVYTPFVPIRNLVLPFAAPLIWRTHRRNLAFKP
jgi:2-polyprenyl-6-methoxyphenol hydroxylase-like FAD-dependent oxidoreductase